MVAIVPYTTPIDVYANAQIVIPDIGLSMHRQGTGMRPHMPRWCLDMQDLWNFQTFTGPFVLDHLRRRRRSCTLCEHCESVPSLPNTVELVVCQLCLSTFHCECAATLGGLEGSESVSLDTFTYALCSSTM